MAKAKSKTPKPREEWERKPLIVQMRGSEEFKAWLESLAEKRGFSVSMLMEQAVREWAKKENHPDPPKR